jgi:hypothetical protein
MTCSSSSPARFTSFAAPHSNAPSWNLSKFSSIVVDECGVIDALWKCLVSLRNRDASVDDVFLESIRILGEISLFLIGLRNAARRTSIILRR